MFLNEVEEVLDVTTEQDFQKVMVALFQQVRGPGQSRCRARRPAFASASASPLSFA